MKINKMLTIVSILLIFSAWGSSGVAAKDTIVIAQTIDAYSMDPTQHTNFPTASVLFHIYDSLLIRNEKGDIEPGLATDWTNPDDLTWRFSLREGVSFHNGEPFNAEAVKFSIERAVDPETGSPYRSRIASIKKVEIVDEFTVDIITHEPDPVLPYRIIQASFPTLIVPPEHVKANEGFIPDDDPVGTGPYTFVEWKKDEQIVMKANPNYWGGKPEIENIIWRPIPEASTRISALRRGEVDIATNISPERVAQLESDSNTNATVVPSDFIYFVAFNTLDVPAFQDKKVRQALNYAVDVDALLQSIMMGHGERVAITLPKNAFAYPDHLEPRGYDPERAREMLAEAGYEDPSEIGTIEFMSRRGRYLKDAELVEAIASYLRAVGLDVQVTFVEAGVWGSLGEVHGRGDMNFPGWSGLDPDLVWYPILTTGQFQSYFSHKELDELLMEARSTVDQEKRLEIYTQAADIIYEYAPHIPLFQPPLIYGISASLVWEPSGDDLINIRGAYFSE